MNIDYHANQIRSKGGGYAFHGPLRQRGSGFGSLAAAAGRIVVPVARKYLLPAAKSIGKEFLQNAAPEMLEVITGKKKAKKALKNVAAKTIKKQLGGGRRKLNSTRSMAKKKTQVLPRRLADKQKKPNSSSKRTLSQRRQITFPTNPAKRSRKDFFSSVIESQRI